MYIYHPSSRWQAWPDLFHGVKLDLTITRIIYEKIAIKQLHAAISGPYNNDWHVPWHGLLVCY